MAESDPDFEEDELAQFTGTQSAARPKSKTPRKKQQPVLLRPHQSSIDSDSEEFERSLELVRRRSRVRGGPRISADAEALVGEGNLKFASGDIAGAIACFEEVIRVAPNYTSAYGSLGLFYEQLGDLDKAIAFHRVGADLDTKPDPEKWRRLAELYKQQGEIKHAAYCYKRVCGLDTSDLGSMWERSILLVQLHEVKKAIELLLLLLQKLPHDPAVRKELAKLYHNSGQTEEAVTVLKDLIDAQFQDMDAVNIMCELLLSLKKYKEVQELCQRVETVILRRSELFPLDLSVKLGIALAHMGEMTAAESYWAPLWQQTDVSQYGDLYIDVADTLIAVHKYSEANIVVEKLLRDPLYQQPAIWMKSGIVKENLNRTKEAIYAYEQVAQMAPGNIQACTSLLKLYGNKDEKKIIKFLDSQFESEEMYLEASTLQQGAFVLHALCEALYKAKLWDRFLSAAYPLLSSGRSRNKKLVLDSNVARGLPVLLELIGAKETMDFITRVVTVMATQGRTKDAHKLLLASIAASKREFSQALHALTIAIALVGGEYAPALESVKKLVSEYPEDPRAWEVYCTIIRESGHTMAELKWLGRLCARFPSNAPIMTVLGHYSMATGYSKNAIAEYLRTMQIRINDPLLLLCTGVALVNMSTAKSTMLERHDYVMRAFAFLFKYHECRGENQESCYNLGRAFHQLGITHLAVQFYEQALAKQTTTSQAVFEAQVTSATTDTDAEELANVSTTFRDALLAVNLPDRFLFEAGSVDLSREAAFNLQLLYRDAGNLDLALEVTEKYLCV